MPHSFCARGCPCWTFPPEGQKQALRMENLSQHMFAHAGLFPRKAKKRPCGWKISLSTCSRLLDFSPGRPKNGLSDGKSLSTQAGACWTFPPEGQKTAFRMENLSQHMFVPAGLFPRKAKKRPLGWNYAFSALAAAGGCIVRSAAAPPPRDI